MTLPVIGPIFAVMMLMVFMFSMAAGFMVAYPFVVLLMLLPTRLRSKLKSIRVSGLATSIPMLLGLYVCSYLAGQFYLSESPGLRICWWVTAGSVVTAMLADEIYSLVRYYLIIGKIKVDLDAYK